MLTLSHPILFVPPPLPPLPPLLLPYRHIGSLHGCEAVLTGGGACQHHRGILPRAISAAEVQSDPVDDSPRGGGGEDGAQLERRSVSGGASV